MHRHKHARLGVGVCGSVEAYPDTQREGQGILSQQLQGTLTPCGGHHHHHSEYTTQATRG